MKYVVGFFVGLLFALLMQDCYTYRHVGGQVVQGCP